MALSAVNGCSVLYGTEELAGGSADDVVVNRLFPPGHLPLTGIVAQGLYCISAAGVSGRAEEGEPVQGYFPCTDTNLPFLKCPLQGVVMRDCVCLHQLIENVATFKMVLFNLADVGKQGQLFCCLGPWAPRSPRSCSCVLCARGPCGWPRCPRVVSLAPPVSDGLRVSLLRCGGQESRSGAAVPVAVIARRAARAGTHLQRARMGPLERSPGCAGAAAADGLAGPGRAAGQCEAQW